MLPRRLRAGLKTCLLLCLLFLLPFSDICAQEAPAPVRRLVYKLKNLKSFRAQLSLSSKEQVLSGTLSYQEGSLHLRLDDGRVIAANAIYTIVYNPQTGVAGKQLVEEKLTGGLEWLLKGFSYELLSSSKAIARALHPRSYIQGLSLEWDEQYLLKKLVLLRSNQKQWFALSLFDVRELTAFSPSLFSYRPPTGSRTVENVLNRKKR